MFALQPYCSPFGRSFATPAFRHHNDLFSVLELLGADGFDSRAARSPPTPETATPSYRLLSSDDSTTVAVELPGVDKQHIDVRVMDRALTVHAKRFDLGAAHSAQTAPSSDAILTHHTHSEAGSEIHNHKAHDQNKRPSKPSHNDTPNNNTSAQPQSDQGNPPDQSNQPKEQDAPVPSLIYRLRVNLGPHADCDKITCQSYQDGVLTLQVPHRRKHATRQLSIN